MTSAVIQAKRQSLQTRLDALLADYKAVSDEIPRAMEPDRVIQLERRLVELEQKMSQVEADLRALDGASPPAGADADTAELARLRETLIDRTSLSEIKTFCFDLGIDYEDLDGGTRTEKVVALIKECKNRQKIPALLAVIRRARPDIKL